MNTYLEVIRALVPFWYVQHYRYYRGKKIVSYILGDLAPVVLYVWFYSAEVNLIAFVLTWILFWTFYEIGYLLNDCWSVKNENKPSKRVPKSVEKAFPYLILVRVLFGVALGWFLVKTESTISFSLLLNYTVLVSIVFLVHNFLKAYKGRIITLMLLGVLKPIFVPAVLSINILPLIVVMIPSLVIKLFDYATEKGLCELPLRTDSVLRLKLIFSFAFLLIVVEPILVLVYCPIVLNALFIAIRGVRKTA